LREPEIRRLQEIKNSRFLKTTQLNNEYKKEVKLGGLNNSDATSGA